MPNISQDHDSNLENAFTDMSSTCVVLSHICLTFSSNAQLTCPRSVRVIHAPESDFQTREEGNGPSLLGQLVLQPHYAHMAPWYPPQRTPVKVVTYLVVSKCRQYDMLGCTSMEIMPPGLLPLRLMCLFTCRQNRFAAQHLLTINVGALQHLRSPGQSYSTQKGSGEHKEVARRHSLSL
jgi:hypothetical protein